MRDRERLAFRLVEVRDDVPLEIVVQHRNRVRRELDARVLRGRAVQIEENEARTVAAPDVVDDLIVRALAVVRRVQAEAVVKESIEYLSQVFRARPRLL